MPGQVAGLGLDKLKENRLVGKRGSNIKNLTNIKSASLKELC